MSDELFTMPDSKPDALFAARFRLDKIREDIEYRWGNYTQEQREESKDWHAKQREYRAAKSAVIALETAALKSL